MITEGVSREVYPISCLPLKNWICCAIPSVSTLQECVEVFRSLKTLERTGGVERTVPGCQLSFHYAISIIFETHFLGCRGVDNEFIANLELNMFLKNKLEFDMELLTWT